MSSARVGAVLRHIRKLTTARKDHEEPDGQLLERFVGDNDEAAFAALLERHGPMVLGVCRGVLNDLHDAEDAFQATFLLLAQKAGSIHRRETTVSGWLYRVAYHAALRARANAARRRIHERRAVTVPSTDPVLDLSLRELHAVLNEELQRLPEEFRAPLVLCCLEEKSLQEAARLLGWTKTAVKGRLQRGRERLRSRLRRRGLEVPAGLFAAALALSSGSAQVPAALAQTTLRAALKVAAGEGAVAGVVSAEVAALVQGASQTMFHGKVKIATALLLTLSVAASAFAVARHQPAAEKPAQAQGRAEEPKAQAKAEAEATVEVRGRVLDLDGKPVAGAKVYLGTRGSKARDYTVRATSGPEGRFNFTFARSELDKTWSDTPTGQVLVTAKDFGFDVATVGRLGDNGEATLRLVKDMPLSGRILDQEGRPVAGAKVRVTGVMAYTGEDLTGPLEEFRKSGSFPNFVKGWTGSLPGQPSSVTTGADGMFRLTGLGRERLVSLIVEGPGIEYAPLQVMTRAGKPVVGGSPHHRETIYGATFDYLAAPSRAIHGVVRDKETGLPVAGVRVTSYRTTHEALTDKAGRYELLGCAKSKDYHLMVEPVDGQAYFRANASFSDTPGLTPLAADLELVRGIPVRGQVTDKKTGKPIQRALVAYYALFPNPNSREGLGGRDDLGYSYATTGRDGSYAVVALPGPGLLAVTAPNALEYMPACVTSKEMKEFYKTWVLLDELKSLNSETVLQVAQGTSRQAIIQQSYNALALIEPAAKADKLTRDVALELALTRKGSVTGPDGKPVVGVEVFGLLSHSPFAKTTLDTADFTVSALGPKQTRELLFIHREKGLGYFQKVRGDDTGRLAIRLVPLGMAKGRVVDADGQPITGLVLNLYRSGLRSAGVAQVKTDKDGHFRALGLVPGQKYDLESAGRSLRLTRPVLGIVVEPGKDKDLGDIEVSDN